MLVIISTSFLAGLTREAEMENGTKVTFPGEGDEGPGVLPADAFLIVTER